MIKVVIIRAPDHRPNPSAPVVEGSVILASTTDQYVQSTSRITAFIRPTGSNHKVFYSVEVTTNHGSRTSTIDNHRVKPDDICKWVSLNELTRFEHRQFLDEQAREKAKLARRHHRRAGRRPSTIRPLGSVEETEVSANDNPQDARGASSTPFLGQKRPRGRPRKHLFRVQIRPAHEEDPSLSSVATSARKRRRESSTSSHGSDEIPSSQGSEINKLASAGTTSRRRNTSFQHMCLPQVKKRVKKSESLMLEQDPIMIYNPGSDHDDSDVRSPERHFVASRVTDASATSGHLDDNPQPRSDLIASTRLSLDPHISDENALADLSSEEDELATLQTRFNATPRNRLQHSTVSSPRTTLRKGESPVSVTSSSNGQDDTVIPIHGREASLDLGASSSSEDSMRQSPTRLQSRSGPPQHGTAANQTFDESSDSMRRGPIRLQPRPADSPYQDATVENHTIDESSDSMISSPVRLESRPAESYRSTGEIEIVDLSSDEESDEHVDLDQRVAEGGSEAESEATGDDAATEPENAYADLVIPSIPSSQSFRNQASSVSSEEFTNVVVQKSEAQATTRRARLNAFEPQRSRDVMNGTSRSNKEREIPAPRPSNQTPTQRAFNISIQLRSSKSEDSPRPGRRNPGEHTAADQLHTTRSPQQQHRSYRGTFNCKQLEQNAHIRPSNPFQQFSQHLQHPTKANSLASMGAGQTFPSTTTVQHRSAASSTSAVDSSTHNNPYGRPLPLHPVTPPGTLGNKSISNTSIDTNGNKSRSTTRRRSRQSMTPLFPRRAIIPDLLGSKESPSKRKEKILSTQQFQV